MHFAKEPHQFSGKTETVRLVSPRPSVRGGTKFIAEVPEGTKLTAYRGDVIAAGPNLPPHFVTADGLVPIVATEEKQVLVDNPIVGAQAPRKAGRPATGFDRKAYQRQKAKERRAAVNKGKT